MATCPGIRCPGVPCALLSLSLRAVSWGDPLWQLSVLSPRGPISRCLPRSLAPSRSLVVAVVAVRLAGDLSLGEAVRAQSTLRRGRRLVAVGFERRGVCCW